MQPKRALNLFDFTMIMVSCVIGMGIFRTPVNVAAASPSVFIFFLSWAAGGLIALCGALTYAEIGSRFPVTGGYYKIFSYAYHPSIAFGVNCIILISNAASVAGVALIGAEYIIRVFFPGGDHLQMVQVAIAIGSITIFYGINLLGLKMSARTQNVLTVIKIALVFLIIAPLFFHHSPVNTISIASGTTADPMQYLKAFGLGLVAVSFTYGGYQQSINFGEEVKKPASTVPRGIFIGIVLIIALYMLINYAYVQVIGFQQLKTSTNIAAIMASHVFGPAAGDVLSVLLFLSVLAYVNVLLMSNPRVMQAMSEDKVLPAAFGRRTAKRNVLLTSLSVFAALCALIVFWAGSFDRILSFTIFLDCFGMALSAATIFVLRKRTSHLDDTGIYKMRNYPLMPIIFIAAYVFVGISIAADYKNNGYAALTGLAVLGGFIVIYFLARRSGIKEAEPAAPMPGK